jgi:hypothetical protein
MDLSALPRICVISSGQDRVHKTCSDLFKKQILSHILPIDFYGLFWSPWDQEKLAQHLTGFRKNTIWTSPPRQFEECPDITSPPETKLKNFLSMAWGRWLLNQQMTENNIWDKYDIFIYCRPDVCFDNKIFLPSLIKGLAENEILFPMNGHWRDGLNDQVCFAGQKMQVYLNLFQDLAQYVSQGVLMHPETLLKHHMTHYNVRIAQYPLQSFIFRDEAWFHLG